MIKYEDQLKLQAYLDGELTQPEAGEMAARVNREPEAAALLAELRQTREALTGTEREVRLPETREFFWSKIERELQRQSATVRQPTPAVPMLARLRRLLFPAAGLATLALTALIFTRHSPQPGGKETALADSGAFTYHDYAAGATYVWLSYPADNEVAETDEMGTLN